MSVRDRVLQLRGCSRHRLGAAGIALGLAWVLLSGAGAPSAGADERTAAAPAPNPASVQGEAAGGDPAATAATERGEVEVRWERETAPGPATEEATGHAGDSASDARHDPSRGETLGPETPEATDRPGLPETPEAAETPQAAETPGNPVPQPHAKPLPVAGGAIISVRVGGDRSPKGDVLPLAGVRLGLYGPGTATGGISAATHVPTQGVAGQRYDPLWKWTSCRSTASGECNFYIPIRSGPVSASGAPADSRFWVVLEGTPEGWYANPTVRIGGAGEGPERTWQYRFRTDTTLRAGVVYSSDDPMPWRPEAGDPDRFFMRSRLASSTEGSYASNVGRTTGMWSQSRDNPDMVGACPVDVALIADTSGVLGRSGMAELTEAMSAVVDAFRGTRTRMAAFSYSVTSPGNGATNHPALLPVTTAAQADAFKQQYRGWRDGGGRNWGAGLAAAANARERYDIGVFLTAGNPTLMTPLPQETASTFNSIQATDAAIFSANQLKAQGTRIIGIGVGPAFTPSSEANLRAVTGPTNRSDYYRAATFQDAARLLVEVAEQRCSGSVGVQKLIVPEDGDIDAAKPAPGGWEFGAAPTTGGITISPGSQQTAPQADGTVDFGLTYAPGVREAGVRIHEVQQTGYELVRVNGQNATCVNRNTGDAVPVTNTGSAARPAFTLVAPQHERVECTVYNRIASTGSMHVAKSADPASGTPVTPGQTVGYTLTFTHRSGEPTNIAHDDVLADVLDDAALLGAPVAEPPLQAKYDAAAQRIRVSGKLGPGEVKHVTYSVRVFGPGAATANGLLANALVETGEAPPRCTEGSETCTEHAVTGELSWSKAAAGRPGVLLGGSEWTLTPYGADGIPRTDEAIAVDDCAAAIAADCAGVDTNPARGEFRLRGLQAGRYALAEAVAPPGYALLTEPIEVVLTTSRSLGEIPNDQVRTPQLPLAGGLSSTVMLLVACGVGVLLVAALTLQRRRGRAPTR